MPRTKFSGEFNAFSYAFGVNPEVPAFQVIAGNNAAGTYGVTLALGQVSTPDGRTVKPVVGVPITIGSGASTETVTPTSVVNLTPLQYGTCIITAVFGFGHGPGDVVRSGDAGIQEAAQDAFAYGGGVVVIDKAVFQALGLANNAALTTLLQNGTYKSFGTNVTLANLAGTSANGFSYTAAAAANYAVTAIVAY